MFRKVKKSIKYIIIILGVIIMLPAILYPLLQISDVQTYLAKRISSHLSERIKSTISVGRIDFVFFNKLVVNDLLIKDQNNDTMIYARTLITCDQKI